MNLNALAWAGLSGQEMVCLEVWEWTIKETPEDPGLDLREGIT